MRFKPSALEIYISKLPKDLQREALQAIQEENDRWDRGDLTPEEFEFQHRAEMLGANTRKAVEDIYLNILNNKG